VFWKHRLGLPSYYGINTQVEYSNNKNRNTNAIEK